MITKKILLLCFVCLCLVMAKAQDSAQVAQRFTELLSICKNVDFADSNTQQLGTFYKAAPYIVYQGDDARRKWKDVANYRNAKEKEQVDNICFRINGSINQSSGYTITGYETHTESEGVWHILLVKYVRRGIEKKAAFGFLRLKNGFALGDID